MHQKQGKELKLSSKCLTHMTVYKVLFSLLVCSTRIGETYVCMKQNITQLCSMICKKHSLNMDNVQRCRVQCPIYDGYIRILRLMNYMREEKIDFFSFSYLISKNYDIAVAHTMPPAKMSSISIFLESRTQDAVSMNCE